jgi:hypothetical protein
MAGNELSYEAGALSADDINKEIAAFWDAYDKDPNVRKAVAAQGIDVTKLDKVDRRGLIVAKEPEAGFGPIAIAIVVHFVIPVAAAVSIDLWRKVLLPRIETKKGGDSFGKEVKE